MRRLLIPTFVVAFVAVPAALAGTGPIQAVALSDEASSAGGDPGESVGPAREAARKQRAARRRARHRATPAPVTVPPQLEAIAQCESGGNPRAIGGGGSYRGKYQFSYDTWAAVGGSGDPAQASEAEQDRRAKVLYARSGPGQWPTCGV